MFETTGFFNVPMYQFGNFLCCASHLIGLLDFFELLAQFFFFKLLFE